ncbi:MAG: PQQ-binding-like beta-propeller repeat protein [Planctomycetota bacterium]
MKLTRTWVIGLATMLAWVNPAAVLLGYFFMLNVACRAESPSDAPSAPIACGEAKADGPIVSPEPDWPQWNGPRRNGISAEKGLLPMWPEAGPRLVWKIGNLGYGWSSPIIVGDRLYVTGDVDDDLLIFAFDLTGKPLWKVKNGHSWTGSYHGARACCAWSAGKLYHMNAHGRVVCLEADTGKELWAVNVLERFQGQNITWAMSECLLVDGARVIVTPGGEKALMAALDKQSGRTVWTTEPLPKDRTSHASPLLFRHAGQRIIANCSSSHGFAVDADTGKLLWTVPLPSPYGANIATPVYGEGRIFHVTPYIYGTCYHLQPREKGPQPEKAWDTTLDTCTGTVLFVDGMLYGSGYKKHKSWLCLDWKSGQTRYELKDLTTGSAVYADGRLHCLAEDGRVALLRPTPERFEIDGQFRLVPQKVNDAWAHPVLLHGRLYLRYHDTLWCYEVKAR